MNDSMAPPIAVQPSETDKLKLYFEHLFTNSRDLMNLFSLTEGKIIMINRAAEEALGYSLEELVQVPVHTLYPADELPKLALAFERLQRNGYSSEKLQMYVRTGELRDIWTRSFVIQREPEAICLVHTIDVTEENRRKDRELRDARLASLGEASATLAHELMNALQSMQFNLQFLRRHIASETPERTEAVLHRLERAVSHMDDVITGIQRFARNSKPGGAHVSLPNAVQGALQLMRGYIESKGVLVEASSQPELPIVWCDRAQVEQILIILIKNAVQAMAARDERRLLLTSQEIAGGVTVSISDTGGGLPAEVEARMFQAFTTTKPVGVGIGLGLATAKQLAINNGIVLNFSSRPGVGTTFTLTFAAAAREGEELSSSAVTGRNLLVVGDDAETLDTACWALTSAGARVLVAPSVAEAIQLLRVHAVAAIICDAAMYPIRAHVFIAQARAVFAGPICLLQGASSASADQPEAHVECVLATPLQPHALVTAVAALME
jgi:PAS domain S-box-containing protein